MTKTNTSESSTSSYLPAWAVLIGEEIERYQKNVAKKEGKVSN
jgi:hypothetical protein